MMKQFALVLFIFCSLCSALAREGSDFIYLTPASGTTGSSSTIYVILTNPRATVSAFQCDIILPEGAKMVDNSLNVCDRNAGHTIQCRQMSEGVYRVLCYSMTNKVISGTSGNVASFKVRIGSSVPAGTYIYNVKNIVMADSQCISVMDQTGSDAQLSVRGSYQVGDLNRDNRVNATDLSLMTQYTLVPNQLGDLNDDGKIDSVDLSILVENIFDENY